MQFYTNRYSIIMNTLENENTTQEVLWVMNIVENFQNLAQKLLNKNILETSIFFQKTSDYLLNKTQSMNSESIMKVIELIENKPKEKQLFIKRVIQAFKQDKYNIKDLSFRDLVYFVGLVADNQIEDI